MKIFRFALFCLLAISTHALDVRVSPDGKDGGDGAQATLAGARDAVRRARATDDASEMRVIFSAGTYPITESVVFEPGDSGVTYEAAPGAKVILSGGKKIEGAMKDGMWTAKVDPAWRFEGLWVNGRRATRARTPNEGFIQAMGQPQKPPHDAKPTGDAGRTLLSIEPQYAKDLAALSAEEKRDVNVLVYFSWDMHRHRLENADGEGTLQFTGPLQRSFFSLAPFHNLRLENYRAALDAPGEWFLAHDGTLSYLPRKGETVTDVWAPVAPQWIVLRGDPTKSELVSKLTFRGLGFRHQAWITPEGGASFGQAESKLGAAIEADGARNITFEDCEFAHTMTNAAWFRRGCKDITVRKCHIHDLGAGGVKIGDPGVSKDGPEHTSHVLVENTIIQSGGRVFPAGIGALIFHASDCTLRHCDIGDFFYSAVSIGWTWGYKPTPCARNTVEFCNLHHLGWAEMSDMGAVYTLGPQPGTVIRGCHMHDIGCASYGGWGMYNDEGSTGIVWEDNLVHDTQDGGYHQHYGRGNIIRNNIFAFQKEVQIRRSRPEEFQAFTFEQNIVLFSEGRLFGHVDKNWFDGRVAVNRNVYWKTGGAPFDFAGKTWDEWRNFGNDAEGVVADPLFVAPENGDYTLRPESPALKIGFKPFDWRLAGVIGDDAWRKLAATDFGPMKYGIKPKPMPLKLADGFEGTAIGAKPGRAQGVAKKGDFIRVVGEGASKGERCLQLTDGPDLAFAYEPHFYYTPNHEQGSTHVAFDVKLGPGYHFLHEWRDNTPLGGKAYQSGPMVEFKNGVVSSGGRKLADFPANVWLHVDITAKIGDGRDNTFDLTLTLPGGQPQHFEKLPFAGTHMEKLDWIGFISPGKEAAKAWLDEIVIENTAAHSR
jgi:hypothetical protein